MIEVFCYLLERDLCSHSLHEADLVKRNAVQMDGRRVSVLAQFPGRVLRERDAVVDRRFDQAPVLPASLDTKFFARRKDERFQGLYSAIIAFSRASLVGLLVHV